MDDETRGLFGEVLKEKLRGLNSFEPGSREEAAAVEQIATLYKLWIEETKNVMDYNEKYDRRIMENEQHNLDGQLREKEIEYENDAREREEQFKREQAEEQKRDRLIGYGVQVGLTAITLIAYDVWYKMGIIVEETGTLRSPWVRNLMSRMLPKK